MADASDERHLPEFSVYSGRDCLGHAVERRGMWAAFTAEDKVLGRYADRRAATDAIIAAAARHAG
jgi:hypothetical protein